MRSPTIAPLSPPGSGERMDSTAVGIGRETEHERTGTLRAWPALSLLRSATQGARLRFVTDRDNSQRLPSESLGPHATTEAAPIDTLVEGYLDRAEQAPDDRARAAILRRLARLLMHEYDAPERAFAVHLFAYHTHPERGDWQPLERMAAIVGGWDELCATYEQTVLRLPRELHADAWWRLARVYADSLELFFRALSAVDTALTLEPSHRAARELKRVLLRKTEQFSELAELLSDAIEVAGREERPHLRRELAALYEEQLNNTSRAIEHYHTLVGEAPGDLEPLHQLERLYHREGRIREQLDILQTMAGLREDVGERVDLYRRMAALWEEHLGDNEAAAECLEWALATALPSDNVKGELYSELRRLYRVARRWHAAIDVCQRAAEHAKGDDRATLLAQAADLLARELSDHQGAIELLRKAAAISSTPEALWPQLTELLEASGDYVGTIELLEERAAHTGDAAMQAALYHRAGELTAEHLEDREGSEELMRQALNANPSHLPALWHLAEHYHQSGRAAHAVALLEETAKDLPQGKDRVRARLRAGELAESAGMHDMALTLFQDLVQEVPDHAHANKRIVDLLWHTERYEDMIEATEALIPKERDPRRLATHWARIGHAAYALERYREAAQALDRAVVLSPDAEVRRKHGEAHYHVEHWSAAAQAIEELIEHHASELDTEQWSNAHFMLATCYHNTGKQPQARHTWQQILTRLPEEQRALRALAASAETSEQKLAYQRQLVTLVPIEERASIHIAIGDLERAHKRPDKALAAYHEARLLKPHDRHLLHRCLDLHAAAEDWAASIEDLQHLIAIEDDLHVRARYRRTVAAIYRESLGRPADALPHLYAALKDDPGLGDVASWLEAILIEAEDWHQLRNYYCERILQLEPKRKPGSGDGVHGPDAGGERLRLWTQLAAVCRDRLHDYEGASTALSVVAHIQPHTREHRQELAALYFSAGADHADKAIAEYRRLLSLDPSQTEAYRALYTLYQRTQRRAHMQACANSLRFLARRGLIGHVAENSDIDDTNAASLAPISKAISKAINKPPPIARPLSKQLFARLRDPGEEGPLAELSAILAPAISRLQAGPATDLGLAAEDLINNRDDRAFARAYRRLVRAYGLASPRFYVSHRQQRTIAFATIIEHDQLIPAIVLGRIAALSGVPSAIGAKSSDPAIPIGGATPALNQIVEPLLELSGPLIRPMPNQTPNQTPNQMPNQISGPIPGPIASAVSEGFLTSDLPSSSSSSIHETVDEMGAHSEDTFLCLLGPILANLCPSRHLSLLLPQPHLLARYLGTLLAATTPGWRGNAAQYFSRTARQLVKALSPTQLETAARLAREVAGDEGSSTSSLEQTIRAWMAAQSRTALNLVLTLSPDLDACADHQRLGEAGHRAGPQERQQHEAYYWALARANIDETIMLAREHLTRFDVTT